MPDLQGWWCAGAATAKMKSRRMGLDDYASLGCPWHVHAMPSVGLSCVSFVAGPLRYQALLSSYVVVHMYRTY